MDAGEKALEYLRCHHVATLATFDDDMPWASAVFYVNNGYDLFFLSAPTTRHAVNLARNPRVAATVQEDYDDWPKIKGVQLEGHAQEIRGAEETTARELYGKKYAIVGKLAQAPAFIVKALAKVRWYKIHPTRMYFIDNTAGFGHRDEIDLP
jgi:uncharacterized protein YhbP (UPF0306 family)